MSNHLGVNLMQFKDEVEKRTDKAVSVEIFDNARLYRDNEVVGAVSSGTIEMGVMTIAWFRDKVSCHRDFRATLPLQFQSARSGGNQPDSERRGNGRSRPVVAILRVQRVLLQGSRYEKSHGNPRSKDPRVRREYGELHQALWRYPVRDISSKQHQAVKDGTVDMVMTGITGVDSRELWKVTDTITRTEHAALEFLVIIQEKVWQTLAETHKTNIMEAARKAERDRMADIEAKAYAFAREKGMTRAL